jgi:poly-gamma-glutamate capsule biosynthesis protein CapA/YwtB (metallophosphatase superfamily)
MAENFDKLFLHLFTRREKPWKLFTAIYFGALIGCIGSPHPVNGMESAVDSTLAGPGTWEEAVFGGSDPLTGTVDLVAAGDVMLGGNALPTLQKEGPAYPFRNVLPILCSSDACVVNLEAPIATEGQAFEKTYTFRVPPRMLAGPVGAGIDVFTLANNHIMDFGPKGLASTLAALDTFHVLHCGAGRDRDEAEAPAILEIHGLKIGFLAFSYTFPEEFWAGDHSPGTAYGRPDRMERLIRGLRRTVDLVVVSFHWGEERNPTVKPYQREAAHEAVDWGADLVVGHHPHVLQGLELYRGRLIAYSLGNFVFGSYSTDARESALLQVRFERSGFEAQIVPISVYNYDVQFQPRLLDGTQKDAVILHLNAISRDLNGIDILDAAGLVRLSGREMSSHE